MLPIHTGVIDSVAANGVVRIRNGAFRVEAAMPALANKPAVGQSVFYIQTSSGFEIIGVSSKQTDVMT